MKRKKQRKKTPQIKCPLNCELCKWNKSCFIKEELKRLKKSPKTPIINELITILENQDEYTKEKTNVKRKK